ncbi:hypothetical protein LLG95_01080 [bacterium]|nr:hypothetical protein [bacterium]
MNALVFRCCRLSIAMLAMLTLAGCLVAPLVPRSDAYEYRYRVFQAGQALPSTMTPPFPMEILTERTLPPGGLNHAMDQLSEQGFKLNSLQQIPDTEFYIFKFRKPIVDGYRPSQAPMEFTGVYRPTSVQLPVYYAFTPKYPGYDVTIFGRSEAPLQVKADWNGKYLSARDGATRFTFVLSGDGHSVTAIEETPVQNELQRNVLSLERMEK